MGRLRCGLCGRLPCGMLRLLEDLGGGHLGLLGRLGEHLGRCGVCSRRRSFLVRPNLCICLMDSVSVLLPDCSGLGSSLCCSGLDRIHSGGRCRGRPHCVAGDLTADHAGEAAFQESAKGAGRPGRRTPGRTAACMTHSAANGTGYGCNATGSDNDLGQHGAACLPHIDAQTCHKAVDLLRYLEETNGAEEPNQHVASNRFSACRADLGLHFRFRDGKGGSHKCHGKKKHKH